MFRIFKKQELIRRPLRTKLITKVCSSDAFQNTIVEIENEINSFIRGKEIVKINHSITEIINSQILITFQIDYIDETTFLQRISSRKIDISELFKSDKKGN